MIDRDGGPPPWMQLAAILRGQIASGQLSGRLPSEKYLAQQYQVAVGTVRKALAALRAEGLIRTEHGWGTYTVPDIELTSERPSLIQEGLSDNRAGLAAFGSGALRGQA